MQVVNAALLAHAHGTLKFLLNDACIYFFPGTQQHRDTKSHGLSYEDDYKGNAVAGLVMPERIEIRFHTAFPDARIQAIWRSVLSSPELATAKLGPLYYQGRKLQ